MMSGRNEFHSQVIEFSSSGRRGDCVTCRALGNAAFACSVSCVLLRVGTISATNSLKPTFKFVILSAKRLPGSYKSAFSLIEMVAVIAVIVILMTAGISLLSGTGAQSRKAGTDMLTGMIEQARTAAISSRTIVVLAVAEPGDLPIRDEKCRVGLFKLPEGWPDDFGGSLDKAVLLSRWKNLETGIALIGGQVDGVDNPLDGQEITINYGTSAKPLSVKVHALAFNSRGGLLYPLGSTPVAMRVAEGNYRNGKATPYQRGENGGITESRLKIGRVTARPYRFDG
jgi:prepilin-type N-terminal cleavage/methylation domain-containing protein